jgi:hypothetical protein
MKFLTGFEKLATKDEFNRLELKVDGLDEKFGKMLETLDSIAKDVKDIKIEHVSNIGLAR